MNRRRLFLFALLALLPALGYGLLIRPSRRRIAALHRRIQTAHAAILKTEGYAPLSAAERSLLEDPAQPWRARIPAVDGDGGRLALVDRMAAELGAALRRSGVPVGSLRAVLDPVQVDATLPDVPPPPPRPAAPPRGPKLPWAPGSWRWRSPAAPPDCSRPWRPCREPGPSLEPVGLRRDRCPRAKPAPRPLESPPAAAQLLPLGTRPCRSPSATRSGSCRC